jgi:hypothetical protein
MVYNVVIAIMYRIIHIIERSILPIQTRVILIQIDLLLYVIGTALGIASLVIMIQMFKEVANRFHRENVFKQPAADPELGTWPPPPN